MLLGVIVVPIARCTIDIRIHISGARHGSTGYTGSVGQVKLGGLSMGQAEWLITVIIMKF